MKEIFSKRDKTNVGLGKVVSLVSSVRPFHALGRNKARFTGASEQMVLSVRPSVRPRPSSPPQCTRFSKRTECNALRCRVSHKVESRAFPSRAANKNTWPMGFALRRRGGGLRFDWKMSHGWQRYAQVLFLKGPLRTCAAHLVSWE